MAIAAVVFATGCEEYDFAPELYALVPSYETELPAQPPLILETSFDVVDPDGDLRRGRLIVRDPLGSATRFDDCRIPRPDEDLECVAVPAGDPGARTLDEITTATVTVTVALRRVFVPGEYTLEAWMVDAAHFESNHVRTRVTVIDPEAPPPE
jgi:hypothetical protein